MDNTEKRVDIPYAFESILSFNQKGGVIVTRKSELFFIFGIISHLFHSVMSSFAKMKRLFLNIVFTVILVVNNL